jgi:hypothetical protein
MRLIKNQNTNNRSIIGNGVKFNPATGITTIPGDSLLSPTGDTSQRPTGVDGYLRFNTDYGKLEYYYDDSWRFVGSGGSDGVIVTQTLYSGFNQFDKLFGPLDAGDPSYFVNPATDRTLVFVEQLYQGPFIDYSVVENPVERGVGGEIQPHKIVNGKEYMILDAGTTPFSSFGAANNDLHTVFTASYTTSVGNLVTMTNPNMQQDDNFGYDIDASETYIVIGAPLENDTVNTEADSGAVYLYNHMGNMLYKVINPRTYGTGQDDWFGSSVAINESTYFAVGCYREDTATSGGNQSGRAYLYDQNAMTGAPAYTFTNPNAGQDNEQDHFGYSVGLSNLYFIVGAPLADENAPNTASGKAYMYALSNPNADPIVLDNPVTFADGGTSFGEMVDINEHYAIVAAPAMSLAYIYDVETGDLLHTLTNPTGDAGDNFGFSVNMSDDYAIIGAPGAEGETGNPNSGKAYVYHITGPTPATPLYTLTNPNLYLPDTDDQFGFKVAISNTFAVVSSHNEDEAGTTNTGRTYVYDMSDGLLVNPILNPNASGTGDNDNYGSSLAVTSNKVIAGAYNEDNGAITGTGTVYSSQIDGKPIGTGVCRETGSYVLFTKSLNVAPVTKTRDIDGKVTIDFDFTVNNLKITLIYNVQTELLGVTDANKWTFARTININGDALGSVAIDGTQDVTLTLQVIDDSHSHDFRHALVSGNLAEPFQASSFQLQDWNITKENNDIIFVYNGTKVAKIGSDGTFSAISNIVGNTTI